MFGCFVSAPARRTAATTAAFAALVSTAEAIENACYHGEEDDRPDDDTNDNGPPRRIRLGVQVCAGWRDMESHVLLWKYSLAV